MNSHNAACRLSGFTLIELLITIAITAILLSIAVPAFTTTIERNRLTSYSNELLGSLLYARNEARSRNTEVQLCSSADGSRCDNQWQSSHPIIVRQRDGTVLRQLASPPSGSQISLKAIQFDWDGQQLTERPADSSDTSVSYRPNGQLSAGYARRLCINLGDHQTPFALFQSGQVQIQPGVACSG